MDRKYPRAGPLAVTALLATAAADFANINPNYTTTFQPFTTQRLFTALGSNITDVNFFVAGTTTPATTSGFGAIFSDLDTAGSTTIQYFDALGSTLGTFQVPPLAGSQTLSFLGASFPTSVIGRVRITSGNAA